MVVRRSYRVERFVVVAVSLLLLLPLVGAMGQVARLNGADASAAVGTERRSGLPEDTMPNAIDDEPEDNSPCSAEMSGGIAAGSEY